jgi:hypothetical protein
MQLITDTNTGILVNTRFVYANNLNGDNPFLLIFKKGNFELIQNLIFSKSHDISFKNCQHNTILHYMATNRQISINKNSFILK